MRARTRARSLIMAVQPETGPFRATACLLPLSRLLSGPSHTIRPTLPIRYLSELFEIRLHVVDGARRRQATDEDLLRLRNHLQACVCRVICVYAPGWRVRKVLAA